MKTGLKKVLSVFLSALMVVGVVPTFALTASAAEKNVGLVAEYFSGSDLSMDYSGNGNTISPQNVVWWTDAEKPGTWGVNGRDSAYFNNQDTNKNATVVINDVFKNKGVTASTGFSIGWQGYAYKDDNWRRYFDLCTSSDDAYTFVTVTGRTGIKKTGSGDVTNADGGASSVTIWYDYLLSCDSNGATLYRNGELFAHAYYSEGQGNWLDKMINEADLKIAQSAYSGDSWLDGLIREMRIYDTACTPAEAESATADNYKSNRIDRSVPEIFNSSAYHENSVANGGYSNVVWHTPNSTNWSGTSALNNNFITVAGFTCKVALPRDIVLVYDGVNDVSQPAVFEYYTNNNSNRMKTLFPNWNGVELMEFRDFWHGYTDKEYQQFNYTSLGDITGFAANHDLESEKQTNKDTHRFIYNKLFYKGTGNFETYYDKIQNLKFDLYAKQGSNNYGDNTVYSNGLTYVINYKPMYDILDTKDYAGILSKKAHYTEDSFNAFYNAVKTVATLDVNGYFANETGSTVEANVIAASNAIKNAVNTYNTAKANLEIQHFGGTATCTQKAICDECDVEYGELLAHIPETVTGTPATCTTDGLTDGSKCSACGTILTAQQVENATGHDYEAVTVNYVTTYTCKNGCGSSYLIDKSALAAAIKTAEDEYLNNPLLTAKYQEPYITLLRDAVDSGKFKLADKDTTQSKVNISTEQIETSITNLVRDPKTYSVTVNVIYGDDNQNTDYYSATYGEVFNTEIPLQDDQRIYKWTMTTNDRDTKLNTNDSFISQVITGDVTFNCYIDAGKVEGSNTARVVYYDKNNKVVKLDYVPIGTYVDFSVEAPKIAFYTFTGWEPIFGEYYCASAAGVELRAKYEYSQSQANQVSIVGVGDVKVNGVHEYKAYYDEVIDLTGATSYAYGNEAGDIIEGISGSYIYAPNNQKIIYIVAGEATNATTKLTGWIDDNNAITVNAQYYLPSDCSFVEAGVKVAKTADAVQSGFVFKSNLQGETGEYSITMGYGSSKGTLYFASYLTYIDNSGNMHTIYSDAEPISFGA